MKIFFWQNILSIHQSAFLSALSEVASVNLIVEKESAEYRQKEGWSIPNMNKVVITISPTINTIRDIIDIEDNAIHVFSGINAYPQVYQAFKYACSKKRRIMLYLEPFDWTGLKGSLRWWKYFLLKVYYNPRIAAILPTGETGCNCYRSVYFPNQKIFEWGYFTKKQELPSRAVNNHSLPRLLFVGSLDDNKNLMFLLSTLKTISIPFDSFRIIGRGPLERNIREMIKYDPRINFIGTVSNKIVQQMMTESDLLILPSKYDGWGAVVNEALQNGMSVIASENCGSYVLLDGLQRGEKFNFHGDNNLKKVLEKWLLKLPLITSERNDIIQWTDNCISGKSASEYFLQICNHVFNNGERPIAPWKKN